MLAGHNHGGQIRVPFFGSILVPSQFSRRYDCGTFHEPPTLLNVSRGLAGQHPLRYFCRPEVTRITLRCQEVAHRTAQVEALANAAELRNDAAQTH
jgi:predicted MPP superfamily phosphohydrolase